MSYILGCAALLVFYAYVAMIAFHPRVSDDYAAYYIGKTSNVSPQQAKRLREATDR